MDNEEALARLQEMADTIAANTPRKDVKYDVRLVRLKRPGKQPEVNAFSLPGGIIYVTEGLLEDAQSDHELAGVMAHLISRNVNYDALAQAKQANSLFRRDIGAIMASILVAGIRADAWASVARAGESYRQSVLGGYSVATVRRADRDSVQYLLGTPWSPVGLLTLMERWAAEERRNPPPVHAYGIYQTHPLGCERVAYLIEELQKAGVPINRRAVCDWDKPQVEERQVNGRAAQVVVFQEQEIFACDTPAEGDKDASERATRIARDLTDALARGARTYDFQAGEADGRPALFAFGNVMFRVGEADAALAGKPAADVVKSSYGAMRHAFTQEHVKRLY